jgi:hypothetical protein
MERKRVAEATKGIGRPKVGGAFELVDTEGKPFTNEDMKGRYALVSSLRDHCFTSVQKRFESIGLDLRLIRGHSGLFRFHTLSRYLPRRAR